MKCEQIKELIITNYIDGEISTSIQKEIKAHLITCEDCRQFEGRVRLSAIEPLKNVKREKVPEEVWHKIKKVIETKDKKVTLKDVVYNLGTFIRVRRPALALATVTAVILIALIIQKMPFEKPSGLNIYLEEQVKFLANLNGANGNGENGSSDIVYSGLGTDIEEYFL